MVYDVIFYELDHVVHIYFLRGMTFIHLETWLVIAKMNRCPLDVGGLMGQTTSIPYISNGSWRRRWMKMNRCLID